MTAETIKQAPMTKVITCCLTHRVHYVLIEIERMVHLIWLLNIVKNNRHMKNSCNFFLQPYNANLHVTSLTTCLIFQRKLRMRISHSLIKLPTSSKSHKGIRKLLWIGPILRLSRVGKWNRSWGHTARACAWWSGRACHWSSQMRRTLPSPLGTICVGSNA